MTPTLLTIYVAEGTFYVLLLVFTFHCIFLAYHWFSYGTSKATSMIALATYLLGAAVFFLLFSVLLNTM